MFYAPSILAKKGELGKIWLASHWEHKLTKAQVFATSIEDSCQQIINPTVRLSLRVSGHLLHGVARIHHKKVGYLFSDCSEALVKIKMAFRPGAANLSLVEPMSPAVATKINAQEGEPEGPNRFQNVEPKFDDDDWMKFTPLHKRSSITRESPRLFDDDNRSVMTMDEEEDKWIAFVPEGESSVEVGRDVNQSASAVQPPEYYHDDQDLVLGDEEYQPGGADDVSAPANLSLGALALATSWVETEEQQKQVEQATTPAKLLAASDKKQKRKPAARKRKQNKLEAAIELSSEDIQAALADASDITTTRPTPAARAAMQAEPLRLDLRVCALPLPAAARELMAAQSQPIAGGGGGFVEEEDVEVGREQAGAAPYEAFDQQDLVLGDEEPQAPVYDEPLLGESPSRHSFEGELDASAAEESRKWNDRTKRMWTLLKARFEDEPTVCYSELAASHKRRVVAGAFLEILTLKTWGKIKVRQAKPFEDIFIEPTQTFDEEMV